MSNREEFDRVLQIIGTDEYPEDKEFMDGCFSKFKITRTLMYILVFGMALITFQNNRIIYVDPLLRLALTWITVIALYIYIFQRRKLHKEINGYILRECRPDIGISRYLGFISRMINRELVWSAIHYNIGSGLFGLGKIEQSAKCLALMQESCETANEMMHAIHLKSHIAMYYKDYDTVMACANDASVLYPKARHANWINKMYNDIQKAAAYAQCCKNGEFSQVYSVLQAPCERPIDEVARVYYLYSAAKELRDYETAGKYRDYVRQNAGTTWYGQAVEDGFIPERKPDCYPGFDVSSERLNKPSVINKTRVKYLIIGVVILLLLMFVPMLFMGI